mmetsp:Transcript_27058/g.54076  ORF Transcript_27058/g.54076 Transcript_27058/m.54076 type:complete len:232 (-) Transcript_27058:309-1004(-)
MPPSSGLARPTSPSRARAAATPATSPRRAASYSSWSTLPCSSASPCRATNPRHRYLAWMYASFRARDVSGPGLLHPSAAPRPASRMAFMGAFPSSRSTRHSATESRSRVSDRTLDTCTPRLRWTPLHSMHTSTPMLSEAQSGAAAPQSAHVPLASKIARMGAEFRPTLDSALPRPLSGDEGPSESKEWGDASTCRSFVGFETWPLASSLPMASRIVPTQARYSRGPRAWSM